MAGKPQQKRKSPRDANRRGKKKISPITTEKIEYVDYKDVDLLRRFMSDRAKIRNRRVSGNNVQQQAEVARAVKNAREMGLLPYLSRVTTQRRGRGDRGDRGDRGPRRDDRGDRGDSPSGDAPSNEAPANDEAPVTTEVVEVAVTEGEE